MLPTYITIPLSPQPPLPEHFKHVDVRYEPRLVEFFVSHLTNTHGRVFDPFAGFGTTLEVAQQMGREVYGIELDEERVEYLREVKKLNNIIQGDARKVSLAEIPPIDLLMCSPPFMGQFDQADALTGYRYAGTYQEYLTKLKEIFSRMKKVLKNRAHIIIEVSNLKYKEGISWLAWDVARCISEIFSFQGEIVVVWKGKKRSDGIYGYGYDHSYCLHFTNN